MHTTHEKKHKASRRLAEKADSHSRTHPSRHAVDITASHLQETQIEKIDHRPEAARNVLTSFGPEFVGRLAIP